MVIAGFCTFFLVLPICWYVCNVAGHQCAKHACALINQLTQQCFMGSKVRGNKSNNFTYFHVYCNIMDHCTFCSTGANGDVLLLGTETKVNC